MAPFFLLAQCFDVLYSSEFRCFLVPVIVWKFRELQRCYKMTFRNGAACIFYNYLSSLFRLWVAVMKQGLDHYYPNFSNPQKGSKNETLKFCTSHHRPTNGTPLSVNTQRCNVFSHCSVKTECNFVALTNRWPLIILFLYDGCEIFMSLFCVVYDSGCPLGKLTPRPSVERTEAVH